jgi:hypothetical protein
MTDDDFSPKSLRAPKARCISPLSQDDLVIKLLIETSKRPRNAKRKQQTMAKPTPLNRPSTLSLSMSQEIWDIVIAEKLQRPFDSYADIIREFFLVGHQVALQERAKLEAEISETESTL